LLRVLEERDLSERTIQLAFGLLSQALSHAVEMGKLAVNPCWLVDSPKCTPSEANTLRTEEATRILAVTETSRFYPLWALMLTTGLRPQEVFALRKADLDLDGERVTVVNVVEGFGCARFSMKAAREPRTIAIAPHVARTLREYLATHDDPRAVFQYAPATVRGAWEKVPSDEKRIFPQSVEAVRGAWRSALVAAKVPPMALFSTRHTHTSQLVKAGVHPSLIGGRTGVTPQHVLDVHGAAVPELSTASSVAVAARLFDLAQSG
jgi:integrase